MHPPRHIIRRITTTIEEEYAPTAPLEWGVDPEGFDGLGGVGGMDDCLGDDCLEPEADSDAFDPVL